MCALVMSPVGFPVLPAANKSAGLKRVSHVAKRCSSIDVDLQRWY